MTNHALTDQLSSQAAPSSGIRERLELSLRAICISGVLVVLLAATNAYLALKVGMTVSASIPAAIISMGVLRWCKQKSILEHNIIQTGASAGEALVGGMVFTLPALIILHFWADFSYWSTVAIGAIGGILGVMFSIPLRRLLLADKQLQFPEGTAIANVLLAHERSAGLRRLVQGSLAGFGLGMAQTGFKLLAQSIQSWYSVGGTVIGVGLGFNPALLGAGYIVGWHTAASLALGGAIGWFICVPIYAHGLTLYFDGHAADLAQQVWQQHIRYIGIGMLFIGSVWTVVMLSNSVLARLRQKALYTNLVHKQTVADTDRDLPSLLVRVSVMLMALGVFALIYYSMPSQYVSDQHALSSLVSRQFWIALLGAAFVLAFGGIISLVCGYFAGLVGSSMSPLSGLTIITVLCASVLLLPLLALGHSLDVHVGQGLWAAGIVVLLTALVSAAGAISNDTMQDLKAGQLVGATPWRQQLMLIFGVVVAALVIPVILQLLFKAYGIAGVFPSPGMSPSETLLAPQASLMAAIVQGVLQHNMPWLSVLVGVIIGIAVIVTNAYMRRRSRMQFPVLAVALGIYLPLTATTPLIIGGLIAGLCKPKEEQQGQGIMLACGLVTGSALVGVILAAPFIWAGSTDVLRILPEQYSGVAGLLALISLGMLALWFRRVNAADDS